MKLLKQNNPHKKIYGLFGGKHEEAALFNEELSPYLDDFYLHPSNDSDWKWIHGDLVLLDWYREKGHALPWESIVVIQWDALFFESIDTLFSDVAREEIFLSGLRELTPDIEKRWRWTKQGNKERSNFLSYKKFIKEKYSYEEALLCCLFIVQILPKIFFETYQTIQDRELGMLEYKIPTYAHIWNIPLSHKDIGVRWFEESPKPLNARAEEITKTYIQQELAKPNGWRIFHPYFKIW